MIPTCPECEKAGKKPERIWEGTTITTLAHYAPTYDGDGRLISSDRNRRETAFNCSEGHHWTQVCDPQAGLTPDPKSHT